MDQKVLGLGSLGGGLKDTGALREFQTNGETLCAGGTEACDYFSRAQKHSRPNNNPERNNHQEGNSVGGLDIVRHVTDCGHSVSSDVPESVSGGTVVSAKMDGLLSLVTFIFF